MLSPQFIVILLMTVYFIITYLFNRKISSFNIQSGRNKIESIGEDKIYCLTHSYKTAHAYLHNATTIKAA